MPESQRQSVAAAITGYVDPVPAFDPSEWTFVRELRNPWGIIPVTAGGQSLTDRAKAYMARVETEAAKRDCTSKRHHYVPKSYMRAWSPDGRRVWVLDTATGQTRLQGLSDTCVSENFYNVQGPEGGPKHSQVERMMAVLDDELAQMLALYRKLSPGDDFSFEDFMTLGHMVVLARNRTPQRRRLMGVRSDFMQRHQLPDRLRIDPVAIKVTAEGHVLAMFEAMFDAADIMTTRWLEIWDDPRGRFVTSDSPVQTARDTYVCKGLDNAPRVWWPISPTRAICLVNDPESDAKAVFKRAGTATVSEVNTAMVRGRERFIIATEEQLTALPVGKPLRKRPQAHMRCEPWGPPEGKCRVGMRECYAALPDVQVCGNHFPLMRPDLHA